MSDPDVEGASRSVPTWYHSIELAPDVVTPGYFDLRGVTDRLPWPDVRGKRCLDVGSYDGFYAFELERRGAAEVVAVDVPDPHDWDWPPDAREHGPARVIAFTNGVHAPGFDVAREALGSSVRRESMTIYDISEERLGRFDVVVCGSLLLHLRDPLRGLEAIRGVCSSSFMSVDEVRLWLSKRWRRRPVAELDGSGERVQWWLPNSACRERMLFAAGFQIERHVGPLVLPLGPSHPDFAKRPHGLRERRRRLAQRLLVGAPGVPADAMLARPRL